MLPFAIHYEVIPVALDWDIASEMQIVGQSVVNGPHPVRSHIRRSIAIISQSLNAEWHPGRCILRGSAETNWEEIRTSKPFRLLPEY